MCKAMSDHWQPVRGVWPGGWGHKDVHGEREEREVKLKRRWSWLMMGPRMPGRGLGFVVRAMGAPVCELSDVSSNVF